MNKTELVKAIAKATGTSEASAREFYDAFDKVVLDTLVAGDQVDLGFGKMSTDMRAERMGVNPQTQAKIRIPATRVAKFRAAKRLKDAVKAS